ncbi:uncharacterized protein LOC100199418 isoform X1 [Hydra vulgaris]|uniref:uncharacterized protein LOC100199418 isoform X1 n=1 Tax=Hydra vulgaris TaxID=6087 RepID=UPI0001923F5B|nr:uncharacterized protein LOC100199418 isoform X1 [Hydra vulgaris]XP_047130006.1 uncharacterized protein LOC100199418 isoform X1 [Hydra vulgaris]
MSYSLVSLVEKNKIVVDAVVPSHWIKNDRVFWPEGAYVERSAKNLDELDETWPLYKLVKVKFTADDYEWIKGVVMSSTEFDSDDDTEINQTTANKKIDIPKPFTKSMETIKSKSVDLPIPQIKSMKRKLDQSAELNIISSITNSASSSTSLKPGNTQNLAGSCKKMYPLPDAEFQRKVMFQLAEIKNLLISRTAQFSNDSEENIKQCKSSEELHVLEKTIEDGDIQYSTFVNQLSSIGGRNPANTIKNILLTVTTDNVLSEYSMNGLKKKKKFKELINLCNAITDTVLKSNKNLTKTEAMQLIGSVIKHSSERLKGSIIAG